MEKQFFNIFKAFSKIFFNFSKLTLNLKGDHGTKGGAIGEKFLKIFKPVFIS